MVRRKGEKTDAELVAGIKLGDQADMEEIVRRYSSKVYNLAYHLTHNSSAAEEIMQEVFLTVVAKIGTLTNNAYFATWLYRVTTNAAYGYLRRERRYMEQSPVDEAELTTPEGYDWSELPDDILLSDESNNLIQEAIDRLPESMKTVLILKDVEGMKNEDIAQALNLSVPAVKSRLHRGRLILRQSLGEYFSKYAKGCDA
jgi:RNA polymerase sigma-70 factor (ECF subfamily)